MTQVLVRYLYVLAYDFWIPQMGILGLRTERFDHRDCRYRLGYNRPEGAAR